MSNINDMTPKTKAELKFGLTMLSSMPIITNPDTSTRWDNEVKMYSQYFNFDNEIGAEREGDSMLNEAGVKVAHKSEKCEPTPPDPGNGAIKTI